MLSPNSHVFLAIPTVGRVEGTGILVHCWREHSLASPLCRIAGCYLLKLSKHRFHPKRFHVPV